MQPTHNTDGPLQPGYVRASSMTLPILGLDDSEASDFGYSTYFPDQHDTGYLAEESSASTSTPPFSASNAGPTIRALTPTRLQLPSSSSPSAAAAPIALPNVRSGSPAGTSPGQAKQRLERRGHTKSRRGCFNCKRRRIKCQETKPACGHCIKTGLKCEYPAAPTIVHQPQHQIPIFSLQDMRFFQHYLMYCYPHHPIGSEDVWLHEIPCLSHKYEFLMHAILGFAASALINMDPSALQPAMEHRYKAIKAIKRVLADAAAKQDSTAPSSSSESRSPSPSPQSSKKKKKDLSCNNIYKPSDNFYEECNALIATCFVLTFQSVLLEDGMAEYMSFIRGVIIVSVQMYMQGGGAHLVFSDYMGDDSQVGRLQPHMEKLPLVNKEWVDAAVEAIAGLEGLLTDEVERQNWEMIYDMAKKLYTSSWEAYRALMSHYGWWMMLPHEKFRRLVEPGSQVAVLLATHWIALKQIMAIITDTEMQAASKLPEAKGANTHLLRHSGMDGWLRFLNRQVDEVHQRYNRWPVWVQAQMDRDWRYFGKTF